MVEGASGEDSTVGEFRIKRYIYLHYVSFESWTCSTRRGLLMGLKQVLDQCRPCYIEIILGPKSGPFFLLYIFLLIKYVHLIVNTLSVVLTWTWQEQGNIYYLIILASYKDVPKYPCGSSKIPLWELVSLRISKVIL